MINNGIVAVYDFGTVFKVSVLSIENGKIERLASNEDLNPAIGLNAIDDKLANFLEEQINIKYRFDVRKLTKPEYLVLRQRLESEAILVRQEICRGEISYDVNLPHLAMHEGQSVELAYTFKRSMFDQLTTKIIDNTIEPCRRALSDARITAVDLSSVQLIGEGARLQSVNATASKIFNTSPQYPSPADTAVLAAAWSQQPADRNGGDSTPLRPEPSVVSVPEVRPGNPVNGTLTAGAYNSWCLDALAGTEVRIDLAAVSGTLRLFLDLCGPGGSLGDTFDAAGTETSLTALLPETGSYAITAGAVNETSGDYRLLVTVV